MFLPHSPDLGIEASEPGSAADRPDGGARQRVVAAGGETALTVYLLGLPASAGVCLPPWYFRLNLHHGFQPRDPF